MLKINMGDSFLTLQAILTIISIITAIILTLIFQWWRNRKILLYQILSNTPLLTEDEEIRDKLKIFFERKPVKNVRLFLIKILNNGKQSIDDRDFKKPLHLIFSDDAQVLLAQKIETNPNNLEISLSFEKNAVSIAPVLLNSHDFIVIKAIVCSDKEDVNLDTRIVGIKKIRKINNVIFERKMINFMVFALGFMGMLAFFVTTIEKAPSTLYIRIIIALAAIISPFILAFISMKWIFNDSQK